MTILDFSTNLISRIDRAALHADTLSPSWGTYLRPMFISNPSICSFVVSSKTWVCTCAPGFGNTAIPGETGYCEQTCDSTSMYNSSDNFDASWGMSSTECLQKPLFRPDSCTARCRMNGPGLGAGQTLVCSNSSIMGTPCSSLVPYGEFLPLAGVGRGYFLVRDQFFSWN